MYNSPTFSNLVQGTPSVAENRMLHGIAKIFKYDGSFNKEVLNEFSGWIDDNIGFRSEVVALNAKIQFYIFDRFTHYSNLSLGPKGEVNSTPDSQILEYQHLNLKSEEELNEIANGFQTISDYLKNKDIQYYYMQCYEKYSIYPEHMPQAQPHKVAFQVQFFRRGIRQRETAKTMIKVMVG